MTSFSVRTGVGLLAAFVVGGAAAPAAPAVAPAAAGPAPASAGCEWRLDGPLPLPAGFRTGWVQSTDGDDRFVGRVFSADGSRTRAALWQRGRVTLLPTPPGRDSAAEGVNRSGDVVGYTAADGGALIDPRPVLWRRGRLVPLAGPGGDSTARAVNDAGLIIGTGSPGIVAWDVDRPGEVRTVDPGYVSPAAVTEEGLIVDFLGAVGTEATGLRPLPPATEGAHPRAAGAAGRYVVGGEEIYPEDPYDGESVTFPVLWTDGRPARLPSLAGIALAVSTSGVVVGSENLSGRAAAWSGGRVFPLPLGRTGQLALATAVTERTVVGGMIDDVPVTWRCR